MKIYKLGRILRSYYPSEESIKDNILHYDGKDIHKGDAVVIANAGSSSPMETVVPALKKAVDHAREEGFIPILVACGCAGGAFVKFAKKESVIAIEGQAFREWGDKTSVIDEVDDLLEFLNDKIQSVKNGSGCTMIRYHFP